MSLYCPDKAVINGIAAPWVPGDLPTRDWGAIRATYWGTDLPTNSARFELGRFDRLARFFASSRASQQHQPPPPPSDIAAAPAAPADAPLRPVA